MRSIDADLVVEKIKAKCNSGQWAEAVVFGMEKALYLVKTAPTVERPHGEWVDESKDALKCSACGKWVYKPFIGGFPTERTQHYNPNYCAFCGADMREGDSDA